MTVEHLIFYSVVVLLGLCLTVLIRHTIRTDTALREMGAQALREVARIAAASERLAQPSPPVIVGPKRIFALDLRRWTQLSKSAAERDVDEEQVLLEAIDAYLQATPR